MKHFVCVLMILPAFFVNSAFADERNTLFEGLDAKIESVVDDMADRKSGVVFSYFPPIYIALYGHNDFTIWPNIDKLHFAPDAKHLIRVGKNKPFSLNILRKQNGLKPTSPTEAETVIKSLVKGEELIIRYFTWPQYDKIDHKIKNPNLAFIYNKAAILFGWKDFGFPSELAPVELKVYIPKDLESKGYANIIVSGNSDLGLLKSFDKFGGGVTLQVGVKQTFGLNEGRWICKSVELGGGKYLIICNSEGKIVFKEELPKNYSLSMKGEDWPPGKRAALAAWQSAPLGTIEIEGHLGKRVLLYGFRELWKWGIDNAGFPPLE